MIMCGIVSSYPLSLIEILVCQIMTNIKERRDLDAFRSVEWQTSLAAMGRGDALHGIDDYIDSIYCFLQAM